MAFLPMVLMGVGTAMSAFGQIQQGNAANQVAQANAALALEEGKSRREAGKYEGLRLSREREGTIESQKALYGASGVDISSGSPLDTIAKTASEYQRDIDFASIAADQGMLKAQNEANIYKYTGEQQQMAGYWGAGSTLLTNFGKIWALKSGKGGF